MKKLIFVCVLSLALGACEKKQKAEVKALYAIMPPSTADEKLKASKQALPGPDAQSITKKIIKNGDIRFETNNIATTRKAIYSSLNKLGGYIAEESETNNSDNNRKEYNLKARIPVKNFDLFLENVSSGADRIDSKNISMRDVTTEYIDISAQLANKKKLEERYLELLKKGTKIADLLEIENKLTEIQTNIESTQGQLNYLEKQVEFSELDITFYTKLAVADNGKTFGYKLTAALSDGWEILGVLFLGFIELWPLWILGIASFLIIKAWRKKILAGKASV